MADMSTCIRRSNTFALARPLVAIYTLDDNGWSRGIFNFRIVISLGHIFDDIHYICIVIVLLTSRRQNVHSSHRLAFEQALPGLWLHCSGMTGRHLPFEGNLLVASAVISVLFGHGLGVRAQKTPVLLQ